MRVNRSDLDLPGGWAAVTRLAGDLTFRSAPTVREHLLKAVADQPSAVFAEVGELIVPDDVVLTLFPAIARHAAAWPGIPLVLVGPSDDLAAAFERTAVVRYVPVVASLAAARSAADITPPSRLTERMTAGPGAVTAARLLARDACAHWGLPGIADVAELLATELASNAVRHVGGMVEIHVTKRLRHFHVSVLDGSREPPRLGWNDGRGLLLIDALATAWGCTETADGKVVWATLRLP